MGSAFNLLFTNMLDVLHFCYHELSTLYSLYQIKSIELLKHVNTSVYINECYAKTPIRLLTESRYIVEFHKHLCFMRTNVIHFECI